MTTSDPDQPTPPSQAGLSESSWPEILAATGPIATAVGAVGKAYIEQRGETRRAEINADVERERIQHSSPPPPDSNSAA
ncbi:hypothetical protein [Streptomyces violascens]|uniref:hypothetical protein n=1 Tax=Streptomyces violascens TaxID=67381 RepID=UPI0016764A28|nr:hypothetical protein [Streptomyces violascens]